MKMHKGRNLKSHKCFRKCPQTDILFHKSIQGTHYSITVFKDKRILEAHVSCKNMSIEGFMT